MYTCIRVRVFCRRQFSVKQLKFEIYIILCQYSIAVFFRFLKIKLLVKLTFWTAISSHQVMVMLSKSVRYGKYSTLNMAGVAVYLLKALYICCQSPPSAVLCCLLFCEIL